MKGINLRAFDGGEQAIKRVLYRCFIFLIAILYFTFLIATLYFTILIAIYLLFSSLLSFSFSRFIHQELVHKDAVLPTFAPAYFDTYFDLDDEDFMFTKLQVERFPLPYLKAGAWYLDCVGGFVPSMENDLHCFLAESAPVSIVEDKVEPSPVVEVEKEKIEKAKKGKKGKGKATATEALSTANVATRSATKAVAEASAALDVTGVGSPSMGPFPVIEPPSQSEALVSQLPPKVRKRKAVAPDASVTSLGLIFVSSLIEIADMEFLILAYMQTNAHDAIYTCIQDFLGHMSFPFPLNSFISK